MRRLNKIVQLIIIATFFIFPISGIAQSGGATLFLSPNSGSYTVNKSFAVKVMVNSGGGVGINAAEGVIKYDPNYLTVSNINQGGSIFKLWTADPAYSNSSGQITFGGGSPSAYKGTGGEIFSVTFNTRQVGETEVTWTSGIVLAADGKGTNVFSGFGNAKFTINEAAASETKEPPKTEEKKEEVKGILPPLPEVSSPTHPKDDVWYQNNEPEFSWKVISDLTGVSFELNDDPLGDPGEENDGIVENYIFEPQEDGELYFHLKYQNRFGFGQISHRRVLIDATPPEDFTITLDNEGDYTNPRPKLRFSTTDETSGINHYKIKLDLDTFEVNPTEVENGYYQTQALAPGEHFVDIAAVDNAGNAASSSIKFTVDPLKAPIITDIPKVINRKEDLIIRGTSFYPRVTIKIFIDSDKDDPVVAGATTDDQGNWSYFHHENLKKGNYEIWAKIVDERGAQSLNSTKHLLTVVSPSIMCTYGWFIVMFMLLVIASLILYIVYQNKVFNDEKKRILAETKEAKSKLSKIFQALREEVDELIELADKKPGLSEAERRIKEKLQESLDISEEFISKEVEDVEKEIKIKKKEDK